MQGLAEIKKMMLKKPPFVFKRGLFICAHRDILITVRCQKIRYQGGKHSVAFALIAVNLWTILIFARENVGQFLQWR
ncbi:hypothetical protein C7W93_08990 [Glaciimonas sp. PCH181]|nr:hypothetical protein C7W93_08990 [Glaciimonas sp. PCH181]